MKDLTLYMYKVHNDTYTQFYASQLMSWFANFTYKCKGYCWMVNLMVCKNCASKTIPAVLYNVVCALWPFITNHKVSLLIFMYVLHVELCDVVYVVG